MRRAITRRNLVGTFDLLEVRQAPAVFRVTTTADSGPGSLRDAIDKANADSVADVINFAPELAGVTIDLTTSAASVALGVTTPITISGSAQTIERASGPIFRLFSVAGGASLSLRNLTLKNGFQGDIPFGSGGGAVFNGGRLDLSLCQVVGNGSGGGSSFGGAILNASGATLTADRCTFQGNTVDGSSASFPFGSGGAIGNSSGGTMTLESCTFTGNTANVGDPLGGTAVGGAVANNGTATVTNCTFVNNSVSAAVVGSVAQGATTTRGGAWSNAAGATATFNFCTIGANLATATGATSNTIQGGGVYNAGQLTLADSILFGSLTGDLFNGGGSVNAAAPNIVGNSTNSGGTITGLAFLTADPKLAALANNGGHTQTIGLLMGSPALRAGIPVAGVATDQRGTGRDPSLPDLGAFEVQHPLSPVGVPARSTDLYAPHPNASVTAAYIRGLYQATLVRDPSDVEVSFYVSLMGGGALSRQQAAANFYNSPENRGNQVTFFYQYFLNRTPSRDELDYYVKRLQAGTDEAVIMQNFLLSPEYTGRNDNSAFASTMYFALLGRNASPGEINYYVSALKAGMSREQVSNNFIHAPETVDRVVTSDYVAYLKRQPSRTEAETWRNQIQHVQITFGGVAINLLGGIEFFMNGDPNTP